MIYFVSSETYTLSNPHKCFAKTYSTYYKYQLSLTNPRDALHHGKRSANKGGRSV